jgi:hypothetical protein
MGSSTTYKGYEIVPICSPSRPFTAQFQLTSLDGSDEGHGEVPGTFASQTEAWAAALRAAQNLIDGLSDAEE